MGRWSLSITHNLIRICLELMYAGRFSWLFGSSPKGQLDSSFANYKINCSQLLVNYAEKAPIRHANSFQLALHRVQNYRFSK